MSIIEPGSEEKIEQTTALALYFLYLSRHWLAVPNCQHWPQTPPRRSRSNSVVFAAASLTEPFGEIGKSFEAAHPGVTVVYNFAGSQQLAQQINAGAPADVFASANKKQMGATIDAGSVISGTQQIFARNRLVVIYPKDNPAGLKDLNDLANPGLKLVLAAKEVPVGQYTLDFLDKAAADPALGTTFKDAVLKNVVSYEDNVKNVLTKVALGEADAGIVYLSDISGADAARWVRSTSRMR